jgi:hypothetical protein
VTNFSVVEVAKSFDREFEVDFSRREAGDKVDNAVP